MTSHNREAGRHPNDSRVRRSAGLGILSVAMGAMLLAPLDASAQDADKSSVRYERKSGKVATKNTLDTKFKAAQKDAERDKNRQVDMMTADQFARKKEAVAQEIADKQIAMLKRLLQATEPTDPEYPDLLFRLADHFLDKKAYFDRQAGALYEKIYAAQEQGKKAEVNQLKQAQKRFEKQSAQASAEAVKVYQVLVTRPQFAKYKRIDEAMYFYAFELGQLKREAEMKEAYLRLIREYPTSKYIPNAYLSFADYFFGQNQIGEALQLYQKIVDGYRDSPVYAYALYKMGWCYLNPVGTAEPEYTKSLNKFVETIKATLEGRAGSEANAKQLRRDARRDLVRAYVHAGRPSAAWEFFKKVGDGPKKDENMSRRMMESLAVTYFGNGMYVESTATYKKLQSVYPNDPDRCNWQGRIVVNALATDDKAIQWSETNRLGEYWNEYRDSKFKDVVKRKCRDEARDTLRQMATVWHDEAEKTRKPDTYDLSEKAYRAYLDAFPKDKDAYELHYYYAEILWAQGTNLYNSKDRATQQQGLKKFREAHDEFVRVLERKPDGKFTREAAYAQMLAMKNALEYDETGGKAKACKVNTEGVCVYKDGPAKKKTTATKDTKTDAAQQYPETPYSDDEAAMLRAYDTYQKYVKDKKDQELPKIQYHRVKLMMEHNKFDEAKPILEELVNKFDGSVYAAWAAEMLIDLLTIQWTDTNATPDQVVKRSDELEKWAKQVQTMKVWKHKESDRIREAVPTLVAGIGWKKAEAFQEQGRAGDPEGFVRCGEQYVEVWNEFEDHDRADTLLFNAARCFEAAYLVGNAIKLRNLILDRYPSSEHYQQTLRELGENYQRIAYYDRAAERFEQYADKYTKDEYASTALQNAYLFRLGLGDETKARDNLTKYEGLYRKREPATAAKIFWSKHDLLDSDEAKLRHAREYISTYGNKGGVDRRVVAEASIGQILWRQSCSKPLLYDSCLTVQRKRATAGEDQRTKAAKLRQRTKAGKGKKPDIPQYCGSATQGIITVHPRDPKQAGEAQRHFATVLKLTTKKPDIPAAEVTRIDDFKNAWGMAMVYAADQRYEEYLGVNLPDGLDFVVEDWKKESGVPKWVKEYEEQKKRADDSKQRFSAFFERKVALSKELIERYAKVRGTGSPYWVLAAAARTAVLSQNFADQLYRAEVPRSFKTEEQYFAYCDALADQAEVPQKMALDAFTYCLQRSTEFQFFNEFSRMCEEELQQRNPDQYPATNELYGTSIYTDSRLDHVGVQTDLDRTPASRKKSSDKGSGATETGF
jgi:tetratricopeptide (TPR) repeat protein